jgi:hypothetical protein
VVLLVILSGAKDLSSVRNDKKGDSSGQKLALRMTAGVIVFDRPLSVTAAFQAGN